MSMLTRGGYCAPLTLAELQGEQFQAIRELVHRVAGIHLHEGKLNLVRGRVARRLRALELSSFGEYLEQLAADESGAELSELVDVLTTNQTSFFREERHFEFLRERVFPALLGCGRPLRLWSAGCSTGEEPISLAITLLEVGGGGAVPQARVLATDVSARVLARARQGTYAEEAMAALPARLVAEYFTRERGRAARGYRPQARVARLVRYARLNLMDDWPMRRAFDVIFCRNVMIYFDKATKQRLAQRFWDALAPGGHLFVGHAESISSLDHGFEYVSPAIYRRPVGGAP